MLGARGRRLPRPRAAAEEQLAPALRRYEPERGAATARLVRASRSAARIALMRSAAARAVRDGMLAATPQRIHLRRLGRTLQLAPVRVEAARDGPRSGTGQPQRKLRGAPVRALRAVLIVAVAVSVVHYADNVANFADYPEPESGPAPSQGVIAVSWFAFTAFALAGYVLLRRGHASTTSSPPPHFTERHRAGASPRRPSGCGAALLASCGPRTSRSPGS